MATLNKDKKKSQIKDTKSGRKKAVKSIHNFILKIANCKNQTELLKKTTKYLLESTNSSAGIVFKSGKEKNRFKSLGILCGRSWIKCGCTIEEDFSKNRGKTNHIEKKDLRQNLLESKCCDINLISGHKFKSTYTIKGEKGKIRAIVEVLRNNKSYDTGELKKAAALIGHCEKTLKNIEKSREYKSYSDKLKILSKVIHIINDSDNLNDMAEKLKPVMRKAISYDSLVFATYDDSESYIVDLYIAYKGEIMKRNNLYSPTSIGSFKNVLRKNKALRIDDIKRSPFALARPATIAEGMSSQMIIGCISKGKIIGVLTLVKSEEDFYKEDDEWFMETIAKDITAAMIRFRAEEIFRKQNLYSKLCNAVIQKTMTSNDIKNAVRSFFAETEKILHFDALKIGIFNKDLTKINIYFQLGNNKKLIGPQNSFYDKKRHGKILKALSSKKRYLSADSENDKSFFAEKTAYEENLQSALIFPLSLPSRKLGFIALLSKNKIFFDSTDMNGFASIAENFSIALDNLTLKNESLLEKKNWETTFNSISDFILIVDRNGSINRLNIKAKNFIKKMNKNWEESLSINSFFSLLNIPYADDFKQFVFDENKPVSTVVQTEGGNRFFNLLIDPVREKYPAKCDKAVIQIKDITDIKNIESELTYTSRQYKIQSNKFRALSRITDIINSGKPEQNLFEKIGKEINSIIQFNSGKVWVFCKNTDEVKEIYTLAVSNEKFSVSEKIQTGLKGSAILKIIKSGKPLIRNIEKGTRQYMEDSFIAKANISSVLYVPILSKNKITGCISLGSRTKNAFNNNDIDFMSHVSSYISSYLENKGLLSYISRANAELEKTFNSTSDHIFITDSEDNIIKCNNSFRKYYLGPQQGTGKTKCYEIFCKNEKYDSKCIYRTQASERSSSIFEHNDAYTGRTLLISVSPIDIFSDRKECYIHIATDITEIKNTEKIILKQASQLNTMFENSPDGMILFDKDERIVKASNSAKDMIKFKYGNILQKEKKDFFKGRVMRMLLPNGTPIPYESLPSTKAFKEGVTTKNFESIVEYNDGKRINILENTIPIKDSNNNIDGVVSIFKDITTLRENEEKIYKQAEEIDAILDSSPDGMVFFDKEQKIVKLSNSAKKMLGIDPRDKNTYSRNYFLKAHIKKITKTDGTPIPFEDLPITRAYRKGETIKNEEIVFEYKDGRKQTLLVHILPLKGETPKIEGVVSIFKDITNSKMTEAKLRIQTEELNNIFSNFHDALILMYNKNLMDNKNKVLKMNDAANKLFDTDKNPKELSRDIFLKRFLFFDIQGRIIPLNELPPYLALKKGIVTKNMEATLMIDGKTKKSILMNAIPFKDENGKIYAALGVYSDITEKKMLESKLLRSEKLSSLGTMVAGIAHELNNPLSGILGFSELMLDENLEDKQMEKIKLINAQADRASAIVKNLMIFSKQKGEDKKPVNINNILKQTIAMASYGFKNHQINVVKTFEPSLPIIETDVNRLLQAFLNILKNSYQNMTVHNPFGTIKIKTSAEKRDTNRKIKGYDSNWIKIEFEDQGSGIEQSVINKIFDPFFSTSEAKESIGLGLSITYSIIKDNGGDIFVTSEKGAGTKTEIYLPVSKFSNLPGHHQKPDIIKKDGVVMPTAGLILIISDDKDLIDSLLTFKARHMIKPSFVKTETQALEKIKNKYFHLIVCDTDNEKIGIIDFYRKALKINQDISNKFILTGRNDLTREIKNFINLAGISFLKKPISRSDLKKAFHSIVDLDNLR